MDNTGKCDSSKILILDEALMDLHWRFLSGKLLKLLLKDSIMITLTLMNSIQLLFIRLS